MKKSNVGEQLVSVDRRRGSRRDSEALTVNVAPVTVLETTEEPERRKKQRRRQIDPTTCEREYTDDEVEFMQAMEAYKRAAGRMFPTCSEVLEVVRGLGYKKVPSNELSNV